MSSAPGSNDQNGYVYNLPLPAVNENAAPIHPQPSISHHQQPSHNQAPILQGSVPPVAQPSRMSRTPRPARPAPYSRPNPPSKVTLLPPPHPNGPRAKASDGPSASRKRHHEDNPELGNNANVDRTALRAQVLSQTQTVGAGPSTKQPAVDTSLDDATHQLAQPRDTPGHSQHNYTNAQPSGSQPEGPQPNIQRPDDPQSNMPHSSIPRADGMDFDTGRGDEEELMDGLEEDNEEILQTMYEGSGKSGSNNNVRLYRLVTRMFQKQDAICRTLQGMKHLRRVPGNGSGRTPDDPPPRTSPSQPSKPVNWDQSVPNTEPAGRQPRVARRILTSDIIRQNINKLLKRTNKNQSLPPPPPAEIRYPTLENFGVRWEEMEKSVFNRMAADIVAIQVRQNWEADPLTERELLELPGRVSEHIRYLCRVWKNAHREDAEAFNKSRLKNASAASRRATLYESRLKIIDRFPNSLNMHRNLIVRLGITGTSLDEEHPTRKGVFLIKRRPELSSQVHVLKSKLDLAYNLYCKGPGSKGSQMHTREPSEKVSTRTLWVVGLPVTCLSRVWLRTLSKPEKEFYQFQGHQYNYSFPDALLRRNFGRQPHMVVMSDDDIEED